MTMSTRARYTGYRFPAEIIGHAVWLYITTVGQRICGSMNGCVAVYVHRLDDDDEGDQAHGDHHDK
jgi:hypothetical protein